MGKRVEGVGESRRVEVSGGKQKRRGVEGKCKWVKG